MDEKNFLEKQIGHQVYVKPRNWGNIAILLTLFVVVGTLILYLIVGVR